MITLKINGQQKNWDGDPDLPLLWFLWRGNIPRDLRPRLWFALGETVRLVASGSGFSIDTEAQALTLSFNSATRRVSTRISSAVGTPSWCMAPRSRAGSSPTLPPAPASATGR